MWQARAGPWADSEPPMVVAHSWGETRALRAGPFELNLRELAGSMGDFGTLYPLAIGYIAVWRPQTGGLSADDGPDEHRYWALLPPADAHRAHEGPRRGGHRTALVPSWSISRLQPPMP
jgi:hypothetical protein